MTAPTTTIKVLLIGDSGVGKTSILMSFTTGEFDENPQPTIGIDSRSKKVRTRDDEGNVQEVNLQLWDTAGQERFRTLQSSYYRGAQAVILVYDVNQPASFDGLLKWLEESQTYCADGDVVMLLVGNKVDMCASEAEMPVPKTAAVQFAQEHGMLFVLTSARTMAGISQVFDEVARRAYDKLLKREVRARGASKRLTEGEGGNGSSSGGGCC